MDNEENLSYMKRAQEKLRGAQADEGLGARYIGLAFLASCSQVANINRQSKRDARAFYLFLDHLVNSAQEKGISPLLQADGAKFYKNVVDNARYYKTLYPADTLIGEFLRYADRRNLGHNGLGVTLSEIDLSSLVEMEGKISRNQIIKKGAAILTEHFKNN